MSCSGLEDQTYLRCVGDKMSEGLEIGQWPSSPLVCVVPMLVKLSTSNSTEIMQDSQVGKGKQCRPSIDSLLSEEIDLGESEDDESDEAWSAHDKSDE